MKSSKAEMARAVAVGAMVKDPPHQAVLRLADKVTGAGLSRAADPSDQCCGAEGDGEKPAAAKCCG